MPSVIPASGTTSIEPKTRHAPRARTAPVPQPARWHRCASPRLVEGDVPVMADAWRRKIEPACAADRIGGTRGCARRGSRAAGFGTWRARNPARRCCLKKTLFVPGVWRPTPQNSSIAYAVTDETFYGAGMTAPPDLAWVRRDRRIARREPQQRVGRVPEDSGDRVRSPAGEHAGIGDDSDAHAVMLQGAVDRSRRAADDPGIVRVSQPPAGAFTGSETT